MYYIRTDQNRLLLYFYNTWGFPPYPVLFQKNDNNNTTKNYDDDAGKDGDDIANKGA